jgi:hypothetical protein
MDVVPIPSALRHSLGVEEELVQRWPLLAVQKGEGGGGEVIQKRLDEWISQNRHTKLRLANFK